ncbi:hypothetical protein [Paraburkholderia rhizosphaerae]|uniref:Uncharacterized protein n=1 Tax=Paraburkholderia rhizosphaerae TaxID=480658 RepID=A0A4R8LP86_9BURK|nr:hypothetical protein [Paraburkholderia rhizosphaerae]TDY48107.1 hypothetical protein BX592_11141 [Paraburkholderia rhizosphaerae]
MEYQGPFKHIIYPDESADPCVLEYRIVFTNGTKRLVVVQMFDSAVAFQTPSSSSNVRDQILNRILDLDLRGLPLNAIRLVVSGNVGSSAYDIEVDLEDYVRRGNPYHASHAAVTGTRVRETIYISSDTIIAGRTRVQTTHAVPKPLSEELADAIG